MQVTVKLFSYYRHVAGTDRLSLDLVNGTTVADLLDALSRKFESPGLNEHSASVLIDQKNAGPETLLKDGDEILLLPIVGGG